MISVTEHIERLRKLNENLVGGDLVDLAITPAAIELLAAIKNRVVNEGKSTSGESLRSYSKNPIYATSDKFVKGGFVAQGKNNFDGNTIGDRIITTNKILVNRQSVHKNNGVFVSGKQTTPSKGGGKKTSLYSLVKPNYQPRKSMYLKDGYKQLRDVQGLRTDITNMQYSGQLVADYQMQRAAQEVLLGITTERSADIYNGLTYGTSKMAGRGLFFVANQEEKEQFIKRTQFSLTRLTRGILEGYDVSAVIN